MNLKLVSNADNMIPSINIPANIALWSQFIGISEFEDIRNGYVDDGQPSIIPKEIIINEPMSTHKN